MADMHAQRMNRGVWGWMFFDWAAQPFFTVVTTFIFGPYFVSSMVLGPDGNPDPVAGQAAWGFAIAIGGLIMAILAPVLGSIADQTGPRKPWIGGFALIKITGLFFLWYAAPGSSVFWVLFAYTAAAIAAEFSTVFNDSMLPRIVSKENIGRVSNVAWGIGYLGGMIVLIFVLLALAGDKQTGKTLIGIEPLFGIDPHFGEDARATGPISAVWYFLFILPMFLFTPDGGTKRPIGVAVRKGFAELKETLRGMKKRAGSAAFLHRPDDLSGRRRRAPGAGRRLCGGHVRLVDHRAWRLWHHSQYRGDFRLDRGRLR